ncbi:MAG: aminoglycoside phosphotransferase family protein [Chloroflexi bacterium]|nr:aminoglycoside phosphotransferase family protein [Chloroflexota bacterium]
MDDLLNLISELIESEEEGMGAEGWMIERVALSANGLIYRAASSSETLGIKISRRDDRDRAGREYATMTALRAAGETISARPVQLVRNHPTLPGDALIYEWIPGEALTQAPSADEADLWEAILYALSITERFSPGDTSHLIRPAVMNVFDASDLLRVTRERFKSIFSQPEGIPLDDIEDMLTRVERAAPLQWGQPAPPHLIHCDSNPENMILHKGVVYLIDWENAGWADAAFDIGDLCAHPAYLDLPEDHLKWIKESMGAALKDSTYLQRATVYQRMMWAWWTVRLAADLASPSPRLMGVKRYDKAYTLALQARYWELLQQTF